MTHRYWPFPQRAAYVASALLVPTCVVAVVWLHRWTAPPPLTLLLAVDRRIGAGPTRRPAQCRIGQGSRCDGGLRGGEGSRHRVEVRSAPESWRTTSAPRQARLRTATVTPSSTRCGMRPVKMSSSATCVKGRPGGRPVCSCSPRVPLLAWVSASCRVHCRCSRPAAHVRRMGRPGCAAAPVDRGRRWAAGRISSGAAQHVAVAVEREQVRRWQPNAALGGRGQTKRAPPRI